jgi:hypothetical protein
MTKNPKAADRDEGAAVAVTIRIDTTEAGRLPDILADLKGAGLSAVEAHKRLMMVNGKVSAAKMDALKQIKGVASVREDRAYKTLDKP